MIKKLIVWFIFFVLSFLLASETLAQEQAFMYIYFCSIGIIFAAIVLIILLTGQIGISIGVALIYVVGVLVSLFIPWLVHVIFKVDFYLAFEIATFITCFFGNNHN